MQETLLNAIRAQRPQIWQRWRELLHLDPVVNPLGHPDTLVHLIDWTLDEAFLALTVPEPGRAPTRGRLVDEEQSYCPCGRNPLLAFFVAGEQALCESLVLAQASHRDLDPHERDQALDELNFALRHIARREIQAFCGVCMYRAPATGAGARPSRGLPMIDHHRIAQAAAAS